MTESTTNMVFPIAAVERDTGLGKDTLRAWERRYGFPRPLRDGNGDRLYPADQVARLRTLKRLVDKGHRPGKLVAMNESQLEELATRAFEEGQPWSRAQLDGGLARYLEDCRLERADALRMGLTHCMARVGLYRFVMDVAAPLVTAVGDCWERGKFQVYHEHLFTEVMQGVLRAGIGALSHSARQGPEIVLTTFPQEQHGIGLLMAEAVFAQEGAHCVSLGTSLPLVDIARAAAHADVVALSFSIGSNTPQMLAGLSELAAMLPPHVQIWCGGAAVGLERCQLPAFRRVELGTAAARIAAWRAGRGA